MLLSQFSLQIILFTTDEDMLEEVAKHDFTYEYDIVEEEEEQMMQSVERDRPKTADQGNLMVSILSTELRIGIYI